MRLALRSFRLLVVIALILYGATFIPIARDYVRIATSPFIQFVRFSGESVMADVNLVFSIGTLVRENGELRAQVNELTAQNISSKEIQHENELLRKELSLSAAQSTSLIAAQVISRSSAVSQQSIVVNKGTGDGFKEGMAVVAQGYLVGKVDEALPHTSRVTLLTSVNSMLPVVMQNSRSVGLLKGGTGGLLVEEIPRDVTISPDESVVSSNIGDVIKSGIPVGKVATVISGKSDVYQSARLTSPIDLSRLEVVFGVK